MLKRLNSIPRGARLLLVVFLFTAAYSAFHLAKGVATLNIHLIIGGVIFTAISILLILICWHTQPDDDEGASKGRHGDTPADHHERG